MRFKHLLVDVPLLFLLLLNANLANSFKQQKNNGSVQLMLLNNRGDNEADNLQLLLQEIMIKSLIPYKCVVVISDSVYISLFQKQWYKRFGLFISFIMVNVEDSEDLLAPSQPTKMALLTARNQGCQLYIILIANGLQVSRLLQFGERYRVINTRVKFILLFDSRLFEKPLFYLWRRIVNVVFIRQYGGQKTGNHVKPKNIPWFEITTVPFPSPITSILVPKRLDIWTQSRFRKGGDLFRDKTSDLRNQSLKVTAFAHLPGTSKVSLVDRNSVRSVMMSSGGGLGANFTGAEIEILLTVSNAMNFRCDIYEPEEAETELWGRKHKGGKYTGIIGEMVNTRADIALGDLYYVPYVLNLMDLSVPYNTECLTFLTPESLTDNSWKTLILPFKPLMWAAVLVCLALSGLIFHTLAKFHQHINVIKQDNIKNIKEKKIITISLFPNNNHNPSSEQLLLHFNHNTNIYTQMKHKYNPPKSEGEPMGLYQFSEPINSLLYTYSMLFLVSLPKLPSGWSLRMLTGWYWLYCLLLAVSYRASMTAILSRPTPRVTIDTLQELVDSKLACGGWGEINREFFQASLDPAGKLIGDQFEIVTDSASAVDRVAHGTFAFYENSYFLREALVKRQLRFQALRLNVTSSANQSQEARDIAKQDRNLHIMTDCVIKMPVSLGLQKNSPIKPRVDKYIRRVIEAGLVKKWLDDAQQDSLNAEVQGDGEGIKALMSMEKFYGALVALSVGYFISVSSLFVEIVYFRYVIANNPQYNKYLKTV